jgi:hypothetical protein
MKQIENLEIIQKLSEFENKLRILEEENKNLKSKKFDFQEFKKRAEKINELEKKFDIFEAKYIEINNLSVEEENQNFENKVFKLTLNIVNNSSPIFSISNNFILVKFKEFILNEITAKMEELNNEIENLKNI